jgi:hypothetical protein
VLKNVPEAGKANVVVPAPAHRARREQARGELGSTEGAPPPELDQARTGTGASLHGEQGSGGRIDMGDVVLFTPVLVGPLERPPPRREREPAIPAREVA